MKILIIYYSGKHTKNTEKIANIFKNEIDCDLLEFNEKLNQQLISNYDIVGFGSGIYAGSFKRSFKK
jgi:flavodoxin